MTVRQQATWWGVIIATFLGLLWLVGDVLLPFITGAAIAYFLDPVADRLERAGLSRTAATVVITVVAVLAFILGLLVLVPVIIGQAGALLEAAPDYFNQLRAFLTERLPPLAEGDPVVGTTLSTLGEAIRSKGGAFLQSLLTSAGSIISAVAFTLIVPVVAFYLLLDWDRLVAEVDDLLPREHAPTLRQLAREIDARLAAFVRGQGSVCLILGTYYALALVVVGLQFGVAVGAVAGLVTFIPYVGAIVGGTLSIGLALYQFWPEPVWIGVVAAIFAVGQFLEGNILTPKLVGSSVGLHPVWLLLALSVFGALFGFVGMLVAVPVAATLGVLTRFAIEKYRQSRLYLGTGDRGGD